MSNKLQVFQNAEFGNVRVIEIDGEPWFVGIDVCTCLGYEKSRNAISQHVDEDDALKWGVIDSLGRIQQTAIINESGLYSLILSSKLESAKRFKHWITSEVLPSIRKHGLFATEELLNNPDLLIQIATQLKEERLKRQEAESKVVELNNTIGEQTSKIIQLQPRAQYCDEVLDSTTLIPTTTIAKDFGKSAKWLNSFLEMQGIQYRAKDGQWHLRWQYTGEGFTQSKTAVYWSGSEVHTKQYTCWTEKGRKFLYCVLMSLGYVPNSMRDDKRR